ncbi:MAG TPA: hypothetical protein DCF91_10725 [Porphyromonadaceae bacterium]|nr:hypothetical protein [Porphyromonadaceae bacterium]
MYEAVFLGCLGWISALDWEKLLFIRVEKRLFSWLQNIGKATLFGKLCSKPPLRYRYFAGFT